MRAGCRRFTLPHTLLAFVILACGENRGTGGPPAGSDQTGGPTVRTMPDTAAPSATDTGTSSAASRDSTAPPARPATDVARVTPPKKAPVPPRPTAPAPTPEPPAPAPSDTPPAPASSDAPPTSPPAQASDTAPAQTQAGAPLRDAYHQAPLDTVPQQVYDGWKQFNLNCARCHGEDVLGTTIAPHLILSLKPDGPMNTQALFVQTVCAGRPEKGMPAWCPLGMEMSKIQAMYAYVKGRSDGKIRPGRPALKEGS